MTLLALYEAACEAADTARNAGLEQWQIDAARQKVFDDYRAANSQPYRNQWQPSLQPNPRPEQGDRV